MLVAALAWLMAWRLELGPFRDAVDRLSADPATSPPASPSPVPTPSSPADQRPAAAPSPEPANTSFEGITTFRGNHARTYYGEGPVPRHPRVLWRYPPEGSRC